MICIKNYTYIEIYKHELIFRAAIIIGFLINSILFMTVQKDYFLFGMNIVCLLVHSCRTFVGFSKVKK